MTAQKLEDVQHIPIASAYLCAGCHVVSNSSTICPSCGDPLGLLSLQRLLDRESVEYAVQK